MARMTTDTPKQTTLTPLPVALNFTDDDLEANRAGQLSERQLYRIQSGWRRLLIIGVLALIGIGFVATVLIFLGNQHESPILTVLGLALTLVNALVMGTGVQMRIRMNRDLRQVEESGLLITEGKVKHTLQVIRRSSFYWLEVKDERINVSKTTFFAVEENARYRLYRLPFSKTLLSAEKLN